MELNLTVGIDHLKLINNLILNVRLKFITSILGSVVLMLSIPTTLTAQTEDFGTTRTPQSCPSRAEPKTGAISVEQAKKYLTCHIE
jgi:hypothetical protein